MKSIEEITEHTLVIKKSEFICTLIPLNDEEKINETIDYYKEKYEDATHNCVAYLVGTKERANDDGEPSGTAGLPMLNVLKKQELSNIIAIVTRYFGGVLLGTGGLIRAYQASAKAGLDSSDVSAVCTGIKANITADYNSYGKLQYICNEQGVDVLNTGFGADVDMELVVKAETAGAFEKKITDAFSGNITLKNKKNVNFCKKSSGEIIFL